MDKYTYFTQFVSWLAGGFDAYQCEFFDGVFWGLLFNIIACTLWYIRCKWMISKYNVREHGYPASEPSLNSAIDEAIRIREFLDKREKLMGLGFFYDTMAEPLRPYQPPVWTDETWKFFRDFVLQVHILGCEIIIREFKPHDIEADNDGVTKLCTGYNNPEFMNLTRELNPHRYERWFLFGVLPFVFTLGMVVVGVSFNRRVYQPIVNSAFVVEVRRIASLVFSHVYSHLLT